MKKPSAASELLTSVQKAFSILEFLFPASVLEEALRLAVEKVSGENTVRAELLAGGSMGEVFKKYGIL